MTKDCRIQDIDPFIINTFDDSASKIQAWIQHLGDCARCWIANNQSGKAFLEINDELWCDRRNNRTQVDMPEVSTQCKTLNPLRAVNSSISPFVRNLRL